MKPLTQEEMKKQLEAAGLYDTLCSIHMSHEEDGCFCTTEIAPYYRQILELVASQLQARDAEWESNFIETKLDNLVTIRAISELEEARNAGFKSNSPSSQSNWIVNRLIELRNQVKPTVAQIMDDPKTFDVAAKGMMDKRNDLLRKQVK